MSDHHHHNNGHGFSTGFLLGVLLGAGVVYILGTKKGQELVDEIKGKGLSLVGDFDELLNELGEDASPVVVEAVPTTPGSEQHVQQPQEQPLMHPIADVQSSSNFMTVKVEQTHSASHLPLGDEPSGSDSESSGQAKDDPPPIPSHIESIQAAGRRFFHGIPKRR